MPSTSPANELRNSYERWPVLESEEVDEGFMKDARAVPSYIFLLSVFHPEESYVIIFVQLQIEKRMN